LKETFEVSTAALTKANMDGVDIILWGRKDTEFEIHLETPLFSDPDRIIYTADAEVTETREFMITEPLNIAYIVEFTLSEVLVLKDRVPEAQIRLRESIYRAEAEAIRNPRMALKPEDLAEGHYLLGLFYAPHFSSAPNEEKAIEEYSAAIDIDKTYVARLNRGFLLLDMGRNDEAKADFDYLIENENPFKGMACANRATLQTDPDLIMSDLDCAVQFDPQDGYYFRGIRYMDLGEYPNAIADLEKAVEYGTGGFDNYYFLGLAQLYAGENNAAMETFNTMFPLVEEVESRDAMIADLQERAKKDPEIKAAADEVIQTLQAIRIP
jgi:tetratricopeptide (TPR) repeat protein